MSKSRHENASPVLWIVDQYAVPTSLPGFVRQFEHARLLQEEGWKVRIIASPFNHKTHVMDRDVSLTHRRLDRDEQGVEFTWVYSMPYQGNNWRRYINMITFLLMSQISSRKVEKPSLILASSPHLFTGLAGWILANRFRVPFVFEVRDLWPESLVQLGLTNPFIVRPLAFLEKFLYSRAAAIIALTDGIGEDIRSRILNPQEVHVIPNGSFLPPSLTDVERTQIRQSYSWEGRYVIGWVGAHGAANHLQTLIDAARRLQDEQIEEALVVLIGDGPEKPELMTRAAGLTNVRFLESMPKSEVMHVLQAMDLGVIVHDDTLAVRGARPNKLFDYMASGLPVISNLQGETAGIIETAAAGVTVSTRDPNKLALAIQEALGSKELFRQFGKNGKKYVAETHDRVNLAKRLSRVLHRLTSTSKLESD